MARDQTNCSVAALTFEATQILTRAGVRDARREAMSLIEHIIERNRTFVITHPESAVIPADTRKFRQLVELRAAGKPLQYITGHQEFFGLDIEVTPDVLIPRPETELLVETALDLLSDGHTHVSICDVGTGSGCISLAILHERPWLRAVGLDISFNALLVAARNATKHGLRERLALLAADCFAALDPESARFAMIVSNPPYIAEDALAGLDREVRDHEPRVALTGGGDGLRIIRQLLTNSPPFLEAGGHLLMEIGFDQSEIVSQLVDPRVWQLMEIHEDLQGIPRIVALRKLPDSHV